MGDNLSADTHLERELYDLGSRNGLNTRIKLIFADK